MGLVKNMMVEGIGLDGKGCTDLEENLKKRLIRMKNLEQGSGQENLGTDPMRRRDQLPKQRAKK